MDGIALYSNADHEQQSEDKWYRYFRFFYFDELYDWEEFIALIKKGQVPQRHVVDWSKVRGSWQH